VGREPRMLACRGSRLDYMNTHSYRLAWLFDIDGTLLTTDGAAREAFAHAVRSRLRLDDDLSDIAFAGRTEPLILADILEKHGQRFGDGEEAGFWGAVVERMENTFHPARGRLMPGVAGLLDTIEAEPRWAIGLLTGNMSEMARIKLERFGLAKRFRFGAFGEEAPDRNALARLAVERVEREFGIPARRCVVVGDTEHDIHCARAAGARVVSVATGSRRRVDLESLEPDLMLDDLSDHGRLLEWARGVAGEV